MTSEPEPNIALAGTLLDDCTEGVVFYDEVGAIVYANARAGEMIGLDNVVGRFGPEFVHPEDLESAHAAFLALAENPGRQIEVAQRLVRADGSHIWVNARLVHYATETVTGIASFFTDRSEEKQLEDQLLRAQRLEAISLTASHVAHDLATYLQIVMGSIDLVRMVIEDGIERRYLDAAFDAARDAGEVSRGVLAFTEFGPMVRRGIEVAAFLEDRHDQLRLLLPRHVDLSVEVAEPAAVLMDSTHLEQILLNLIVNAGKAIDSDGPDRGLVSVSVSVSQSVGMERADRPLPVDGSYVVIEVADNGVGIAEDNLDQIFEPFHSSRSDQGGSGLGLAIVRRLVTQASGTVNVESTEGVGSVFTINLPQHLGETEPPGHPDRGPLTFGSGLIVLAVEDSTIGPLLNDALRALGYEVVSVETSAAVMTYLESGETRPDLVIVDTALVDDGGSSLVDRIKAAGPHIPVMLTAARVPDYGLSDDIPGDGLLVMPFGLKRFSDLVGSLIEAPH